MKSVTFCEVYLPLLAKMSPCNALSNTPLSVAFASSCTVMVRSQPASARTRGRNCTRSSKIGLQRFRALPVHCELTAVVDEAPCAARLHALLALHWVICLPVDEESEYAKHQQLVPGLSSPYFTDFREEGNYLPAIPQQLANPSAGEPPARARIGLSCSYKETTNV